MEQDNNFAIQTSLINDRRNSSSIEVEQIGVEKNADGEPFWLQTLNLFGCLYPINIRNYKKWNWKTLFWSIIPFSWSCYWILMITGRLKAPYFDTFHRQTFQIIWESLFCTLGLLLQLSLSYTRNKFADAIVEEEDLQYINKIAKIVLVLFVLSAATVGVIYDAHEKENANTKEVIEDIIFKILGVFRSQIFGLAVISTRCLFLVHISVSQEKMELMEMMRGTEVERLQAKLLDIWKMVLEASANYLQVPLSILFGSGVMGLTYHSILIYKDPDDSSTSIVLIAVYGIEIVAPLVLLTRIDKCYSWTLRELLHRNTVMPRQDRTYLISNYDTIIPEASIFGIKITQARVASLALAVISSVAPKFGIYVYNNLWKKK